MPRTSPQRALPLADAHPVTLVDDERSPARPVEADPSGLDETRALAQEAAANGEPTADLAASARMARLRADLFHTPVEPVRIDRFVVLELLGAGGMGQVYAAYDPRLDRRIALKLVRHDAALPADQVEARFLREAQAMARLSHPNVVQVHEVGAWQGRVFLAMELVKGTTLSAWLGERARAWPEIVSIFVTAGRGLAAAHAAGLVHRDFKPDNVLVGEDGRARVTDFGLARGASTAPAGAPRPSGAGLPAESAAFAASLTASGALAGTPGYMSPEQFRGEAATPASDQFSLCVALHDALYGVRPFAGDDPRALARSVLAGERRDPPRSSVPRRIHRALVRGLALDPGARFPSMDALLDALSVRRPWVTFASIGGVALALGLGALIPRSAPCEGAERLLAGAWDDARRTAVRGAFEASTLPDAERLASTTAGMLDAYARLATSSYVESCEAHQRGESSSELHDLRVACLRHRVDVVRAVVHGLANGETERLREGPLAVAKLGDLDACADARSLVLGVASPTLAQRAGLRELDAALVEARADELIGDHGGAALRLDDAIIPKARLLGHAPTLAEALYQRGRLAVYDRDFDRARETLREALLLALESRHDPLVAELWSWLILATAQDATEVAELLSSLDQAEAWLRREGATPLQRAELEGARGVALQHAGELVGAEAAYGRALALQVSTLGEDHVSTAIQRMNHALSVAALGRTDEAIRELQRALRDLRADFGDHHMVVADTLYGLGTTISERDDPESLRIATVHLEEAAAILVENGRERSIEMADHYLALAQIDYRREDLAAAEEKIALGLEIAASHPSRGYLLALRGSILQEQKRLEEAREALTAARETFAARGSVDNVALADFNLGMIELERGQNDAAIDRLQAALSGMRAAFGEDAVLLADPLLGLARAHVAKMTPCAARPLLDRAAALVDDPEVTDLRTEVARLCPSSPSR
ncbi:MAG: protein kinase [Nannocystaceae bacterium]